MVQTKDPGCEQAETVIICSGNLDWRWLQVYPSGGGLHTDIAHTRILMGMQAEAKDGNLGHVSEILHCRTNS